MHATKFPSINLKQSETPSNFTALWVSKLLSEDTIAREKMRRIGGTIVNMDWVLLADVKAFGDAT